jgi:Arrestin (or S-antigen), N-terminal domain
MSELRIQLERPGYRPGEDVTGTLELHLDAPRTARGIRLRIYGEEYTHVRVSHGQHSVTYYDRQPILHEEIVFAGRERLATFIEGLTDVWDTVLNRIEHMELPAGVRCYPFAFSLPANAPPTYDGSAAEVEYRLLGTVDVPIRMDLRRRQDLMVYPRTEAVGRSSPVSSQYPPVEERRSIWEMEIGIHPNVRATLALPRSRFRIGERIEGTLTVEDTGGALIRGVEFTLTAQEEAHAQHRVARTQRQAVRVYQLIALGIELRLVVCVGSRCARSLALTGLDRMIPTFPGPRQAWKHRCRRRRPKGRRQALGGRH